MKQIDQFVSLDFTEHNPSGEAQKKVQSCLFFSWLSPKVLSVFTSDYMAQRKQGHISLQEEKNHCCYHSLIIILTLVLLLYLAKFFHVHLTIQLCLGNRGRQNYSPSLHIGASLVVLTVKTACNGSGICPGEGNGNPSSILAWRIPRTEEPGGLQSMESQRVRHNWETNTFPS